ncbi:MAG: hypothetical protein VX589_09250 [Myxococcota bacterium]|nr:hypothetical protein [Myxococcota bacterium]
MRAREVMNLVIPIRQRYRLGWQAASRLVAIFTWLIGVSLAFAQNGLSPNAPDLAFYVGLGEGCCGEDPHPVHGVATPDGGYVLVGKSVTAGDGWGGFAVKIGPPQPLGVGQYLEAGEDPSLKWVVRIGGPGTRSVFLNAATTADAVFLAGSRASANGLADMYLAKHARADGMLIWEKRFRGQAVDTEGAIEAIQVTADGGLILGAVIDAPRGSLEGFKSFGNPVGGSAHIVYLSPEQVSSNSPPDEATWSRTWPAYQTVKAVHPLVEPESGFIVLAHGEDQPPTLIRTNERGDMQWSTRYPGRFEPTDLAVNVADGRPFGFTFTGHGGTDGTLDGQLTHVDLDGGLVWTKTFGDPSGGVGMFAGRNAGAPQLIYDECWGIQAMPDGGVVVGCGTGIEGCDLWSTGTPIRAECESDPRKTWRGYLVRFDREGNEVWSRLDSFAAEGEADVADSASEYVFLTQDGQIASVVDQGFGIGLLVTEPDVAGALSGPSDDYPIDVADEPSDDTTPDESDDADRLNGPNGGATTSVNDIGQDGPEIEEDGPDSRDESVDSAADEQIRDEPDDADGQMGGYMEQPAFGGDDAQRPDGEEPATNTDSPAVHGTTMESASVSGCSLPGGIGDAQLFWFMLCMVGLRRRSSRRLKQAYRG